MNNSKTNPSKTQSKKAKKTHPLFSNETDPSPKNQTSNFTRTTSSSSLSSSCSSPALQAYVEMERRSSASPSNSPKQAAENPKNDYDSFSHLNTKEIKGNKEDQDRINLNKLTVSNEEDLDTEASREELGTPTVKEEKKKVSKNDSENQWKTSLVPQEYDSEEVISNQILDLLIETQRAFPHKTVAKMKSFRYKLRTLIKEYSDGYRNRCIIQNREIQQLLSSLEEKNSQLQELQTMRNENRELVEENHKLKMRITEDTEKMKHTSALLRMLQETHKTLVSSNNVLLEELQSIKRRYEGVDQLNEFYSLNHSPNQYPLHTSPKHYNGSSRYPQSYTQSYPHHHERGGDQKHNDDISFPPTMDPVSHDVPASSLSGTTQPSDVPPPTPLTANEFMYYLQSQGQILNQEQYAHMMHMLDAWEFQRREGS